MGNGPYVMQWDDLAKRRRSAWMIDLIAIPILIYALVIKDKSFTAIQYALTVILLCIVGGLALVSAVRINRWKCPRCQKSYMGGRAPILVYAQKKPCKHCGLPMYSPDDPDKRA
jgi:undecaprenyl pyrophosphate phosphatase UppP